MAAAGLEAVGGLRGGPPAPQAAPGTVEQLVLELTDPATRENALLELSKKREAFPELAPYLWHSFGTVSALLQVRMARPMGSLMSAYRPRGIKGPGPAEGAKRFE